MNKCPLCKNMGKEFYQDSYFLCENCNGIFLNPTRYLSPKDEKKRYETHLNDVNDKRYQNFVMPLVSHVLANYNSTDLGLDFGAGTEPVVSKLLSDKGYLIKQYDPFFANDENILKYQYDYIVSSEVVEHFHNPDLEFVKLRSLLRKGGELICKTHIYNPDIKFSNWYYKNDLTHVFIYQKETIEYIANHFAMRITRLDDRIFVLQVI